MTLRRTKIVATLGPASTDPAVLKRMILAGVDVVRVNFSHGVAADHEARINSIREISKSCGKEIGILADLQGPKIRVSKFKDGKVELKKDNIFVLDASLDSASGDDKQVGIDYKQLPQDVHPKDILLLDDGRLVFEVQAVDGPKIICRVEVGGILSNNKGINRQGGGLSAKALTDKDKADLITAVKLGADYIAISFPRSANDIHEARDLIKAAKGNAGIIAKIERAEAIEVIDEIIKASDAVMVARGDLGVEIGDAELPAAQKHIIHRCRALDKAVITATQMMESMIENSIPTRAEVFDVANAVLDGSDAVMLSAETATGKHPDLVIAAMARICLSAEKQRHMSISRHRVECEFKRVDEAIAMATMYAANHFNIQAIIALTESGSTPLWMSRIRSGIPIYALTRNLQTERRMTLFRGVYPMNFVFEENDRGKVINKRAMDELVKRQIIKQGDYVIITRGEHTGQPGGTNMMKIARVGDV
ncbi:MAG TPA: pyruvate kinase [Gammaproteobacteria bacterium]|nr:pyruvate kinase [Gammaproteobacteria bacterium]